MATQSLYEGYAAVYNQDLRENIEEEADLLADVDYISDLELDEIVEEIVLEYMNEGVLLEEVEGFFSHMITESAAQDYINMNMKAQNKKRQGERRAARIQRVKDSVGRVVGAIKSGLKKVGGAISGKAKELGGKAKEAYEKGRPKPVVSYLKRRNLHSAPGAAAYGKPETRARLRSMAADDIKKRVGEKASQVRKGVKAAAETAREKASQASVSAYNKAREAKASAEMAGRRTVQSAKNTAREGARRAQSGAKGFARKSLEGIASGASRLAQRFAEAEDLGLIANYVGEYLFSEGFNEHGFDIMLHEMGLEEFADMSFDLFEEAYISEKTEYSARTREKMGMKVSRKPASTLKGAAGTAKTRGDEARRAARAAAHAEPEMTERQKRLKELQRNNAMKMAMKYQKPTASRPETKKTNLKDKVAGALMKAGQVAQAAGKAAKRGVEDTRIAYGVAREVGRRAEQSAAAKAFRKGLGKAVKATYAAGKAARKSIEEEIEEVVETLIVEGYDLSDFTWDEITEMYLDEEEKWIQGAIKKPGALHRQLGVPEGEKIPAKKLAAARAGKYGAKAERRAELAKTLSKMHDHVEYDEDSIDEKFGFEFPVPAKKKKPSEVKQMMHAMKGKKQSSMKLKGAMEGYEYDEDSIDEKFGFEFPVPTKKKKPSEVEQMARAMKGKKTGQAKLKVGMEGFEMWVNDLIEEGHDLSGYTWDELEEAYKDLPIAKMAGQISKKQFKAGQMSGIAIGKGSAVMPASTTRVARQTGKMIGTMMTHSPETSKTKSRYKR